MRFGKQAEMKYEFALKGLIQMGYQAVGFGPQDLTMDVLTLAINLPEATNPLVSANVGLVDFNSGFTKRFKIIKAGGMKIGVTTVLGKKQMAGAFCETQVSQSTVFGPFANTNHRFLGLRFTLQGKVHYGWARFTKVTASACNGGPAISATLTGYAYETIPNKPIIAGKTKGPDVLTVQPASLGRLAQGSVGRLGKSATH